MESSTARTTKRPAKVTFRKVQFDFEQTGFSRYWHAGSPFISHWWSSLSQAFSPGEKFFIDSVRQVRDRIDDPDLLDEIEEFIRQEAHHTLQHRKFNRMLGDLGYDVDKLEGRYARSLDRARRWLGPMGMLSVTTALEHLTAGFAHQYFENPHLTEGADPNVEALWGWHAAEEAEHKATAFDVYEQLGGDYWTRIAMIGPCWGSIVAITLHNVLDMLRQDGKLRDWRDLARGLSYVFGPGGLVTTMLPAFVSYLRPGFHPSDTDDSEHIERWERDNERYIRERGRRRAAAPASEMKLAS